MSRQQTKNVKRENRVEWVRPEVRRMKAGDAEAAGGVGADVAFS